MNACICVCYAYEYTRILRYGSAQIRDRKKTKTLTELTHFNFANNYPFISTTHSSDLRVREKIIVQQGCCLFTNWKPELNSHIPTSNAHEYKRLSYKIETYTKENPNIQMYVST